MINKLVDFCNNGKFVSVYMNGTDTTKFVFGRILCVNEKYIVMYLLSPNGEYDGILLKSTDSVIRLEADDNYYFKMKKICGVFMDNVKSFNCDFDKSDIIRSFLKMCKNNDKIVSIELLDSGIADIVGFVERTDDTICTVKQVDDYGSQDGYSYVLIENITQISFDSKEENIIFKLWNLK